MLDQAKAEWRGSMGMVPGGGRKVTAAEGETFNSLEAGWLPQT